MALRSFDHPARQAIWKGIVADVRRGTHERQSACVDRTSQMTTLCKKIGKKLRSLFLLAADILLLL